MKDSEIKKEQNLLESFAETFQQFTGSLTGKNLEEKLIEYSEVYGEILLNLYNQTEEIKKENRFLKKRISELENQIQEWKSNVSKEKINQKTKRLLIIITFTNIVLLLINLTIQLWKL